MKPDKIVTILSLIGITLVVWLLLWDCLTPARYEELTINPREVDWQSFTSHNVDVNALIHTLLSALIGFLLTIFFIEKLLKRSREKEIKYKKELQFKNISKIIQVPLLRYQKAALSITYGIGNIPPNYKINLPISPNTLVHVFMPQAYSNEPLFQTNIELYASAVKDLKDCISNILLNVDLTENEELSEQLTNYVKVVSGINPCPQLLDMMGKVAGKEKLTDMIKRNLPNVDFEQVGGSNIYWPFLKLKDMIEFHEAFLQDLYRLAPSFNINNHAEE